MIDQSLNIAATEPRSIANGPGERFVVWVQGCPFRCPGCYNPDFLEFSPRESVTPEDLTRQILETKGIVGATFSGGEPMSQAAGLAAVAREIRRQGLSVVCYTGHTLERLRSSKDAAIHEFLGEIDLLIDGLYVQSKRWNLSWRGSTNQRLLYLTDRIAPEPEESNSVEIIVGSPGMRISGVFDPSVIAKLEEVLKSG